MKKRFGGFTMPANAAIIKRAKPLYAFTPESIKALPSDISVIPTKSTLPVMRLDGVELYDVYVGIDPGQAGAVAAIDRDGNVVVEDTPTISFKKGKTKKKLNKKGEEVGGNDKVKTKYLPAEMADLLRRLSTSRTLVVLESVSSMSGQGVSSMFKMGQGVGMWEGIIGALKLPVVYATPSIWKKTLGLGHDKAESIHKATQLYPSAADRLSRKKDDGRAEAILLAHWARSR